MKIETIPNKHLPEFKKIQERMDKYIPNVNKDLNIPATTGFRYGIIAPPAGGKTNLLLNLFKNTQFYKGKFDNVYLFTPMSSFESVANHPFKNHDKVYHELTAEKLYEIMDELRSKKILATEYIEKQKHKKRKRKPTKRTRHKIYYEEFEEEDEEDDEAHELEWSAIILDDLADELKNKDFVKALKKLLIQTRHIMCSVFITLQSYYLLDKQLRKMLSHVSMFKPLNVQEWYSFADEMLSMKRDDALTLNEYVFTEPHVHLDCDVLEGKYYRNFHELKIQR